MISGIKKVITKSSTSPAKGIDFTVGGAISPEEEQQRESKYYGPAFEISADWVFYAVERYGMPKEAAKKILSRHLQIAYAIADEIPNSEKPIGIYDGGRLSDEKTVFNKNVVNEVVEEFVASK